VPLGKVLSAGRDGIRLALAAPLKQGDGIKFEDSDDGFFCNRIVRNGLLVSSAQPGEVVVLEGRAETKAGDSAVKTSDAALIVRLSGVPERKVMINGRLQARVGQPLRLTLWDADGHEAEAAGEVVVEGRTRPATEDELRESAGKLGGTPYELERLEVDTDGRAFVARRAVNALRRDAVQRLTDMRTQVRAVRETVCQPPTLALDALPEQPLLHVLVRTAAQLDAISDLVTGDIYTEDAALYAARRWECPALRLKTDRLEPLPLPMKGARLLVTDHGGLHAYPADNDAALDYTAGALNADALAVYFRSGVRRIALSPELDAAQTADLLRVFREEHGQLPPVEALVYARHELMVLRHCVIRHALGAAACGRCRRERFSLQDDTGRIFPIITTASCENRLFEGRPAGKEIPPLLDMGVRHFRLELLDEGGVQSRELALKYRRLLESGV
jgi:putative protease